MLLTVGISKFDLANGRSGGRLARVGRDSGGRLSVQEASGLFPPEIDTQSAATTGKHIVALHHQPHKGEHESRPGIELFDRTNGLSVIPAHAEAFTLPRAVDFKWPASVSSRGNLLAVGVNGQEFRSEIFVYRLRGGAQQLWRRLPFDFPGQTRPVGTEISLCESADGSDALLYALSYTGDSISVYDLGSPKCSPARIIRGTRTRLQRPAGAQIIGDLLWVASHEGSELLAFRLDADGDAPPVRTISGSRSRLDHPWGLAYADGLLYAANIGLTAQSAPYLLGFDLTSSDAAPVEFLSSAEAPELGGVANIARWGDA